MFPSEFLYLWSKRKKSLYKTDIKSFDFKPREILKIPEPKRNSSQIISATSRPRGSFYVRIYANVMQESENYSSSFYSSGSKKEKRKIANFWLRELQEKFRRSATKLSTKFSIILFIGTGSTYFFFKIIFQQRINLIQAKLVKIFFVEGESRSGNLKF